MGKASSAGPGGDRRSRIAAQRAAHRAAQRRLRLLLAGGGVVVVVAIVLAVVLLQGSGGSSGNPASETPGPTGSALAALISQVTSVPAATLAQVGGGAVTAKPAAITGTALTSGGKPEVLYLGAEYCP